MMTLGNMRQQGVRSIWVRCGALWCHHDAIADASPYPDNMTVPSFGPRMVCTICGAIGGEVMPNWNERAQSCLFGRSAQ